MQAAFVAQVGHLDLKPSLRVDDETDPRLQALEATWNAIYSGQFQSLSGLHLSTPSLTSAGLGDIVSFLLSHGASPAAGSGRLLAFAYEILRQLGDQLEVEQHRLF